jgi:hypothetical protein
MRRFAVGSVSKLCLAAVAGVVGSLPSTSHATRLIFEQSNGFSLNSTHLDSSAGPNYGDRVTSTVQDGYQYDLTAGPTPAIVARYGTGTTSDFSGWPISYSDLVNVIYPHSSPKVVDVKFTADPGFNVALHSFQMAGWPNADYTINSVKVLNEASVELYSQVNVLVEGNGVGAPHTDFNFGSPLVGQEITIRIDATNLSIGSFANIGLDNVVISQVPEPTGISLLLGGALVLAIRRQLVR